MEARKAGKMLEAAAQHNFHFDTCQMLLNVMDAQLRSFGHEVLPKLVEQGIAVLGMKSMGDGNVLMSVRVTPIECLHYALNLDQAIEVARTFQPMSLKGAAMTGQFEPFKTTQFDYSV
jgi:hypothetical protein